VSSTTTFVASGVVRAQCLTILLSLTSILHFAEQQLDPVAVPIMVKLLFLKVQNAFIAKWLSTVLSQMSILTVGSSPDRGIRLNLPIEHPRPGSFGPHGHHSLHRIDFCESSVLNHFARKVLRNSNRS
jgi:hypothetical protein